VVGAHRWAGVVSVGGAAGAGGSGWWRPCDDRRRASPGGGQRRSWLERDDAGNHLPTDAEFYFISSITRSLSRSRQIGRRRSRALSPPRFVTAHCPSSTSPPFVHGLSIASNRLPMPGCAGARWLTPDAILARHPRPSLPFPHAPLRSDILPCHLPRVFCQ
jgi:hypothetical protein